MKSTAVSRAIGLCLVTIFATAAAAPEDAPVAKIGNQTILLRELNDRTAQHLADQQENYERTLIQLKIGLQRDQNSYKAKLLESLVDVVLERFQPLLSQGGVLVDEADGHQKNLN